VASLDESFGFLKDVSKHQTGDGIALNASSFRLFFSNGFEVGIFLENF
jgi:hypothetical protein